MLRMTESLVKIEEKIQGLSGIRSTSFIESFIIPHDIRKIQKKKVSVWSKLSEIIREGQHLGTNDLR